MVLGIVGKKHAGKDTFGNFVRKYNNDFSLDYYAARLKEICAEVFPLDVECYHNQDLKEVPFDRAIAVDDYLPYLMEKIGRLLPEKKLFASNPRQLMQMVGTEYIRATYPTYWTDYLRDKISRRESHQHIIVADVRFENEAQVIRDFEDGVLIKVVRTSQIPTDGHKSEREQEGIVCPTLYLNDGELLLAEAIAAHLANWKVKLALDLIERSANWKDRQGSVSPG